MEENFKSTPYGNTGYVDTEGTSLRALVDWVSVSFPQVSTFENLVAVLGLKKTDFETIEKGFRGYLETAKFGNILLAWGAPAGNEKMGGFIEMSGQGCREYENYFEEKLNWSEFFAMVMNFEHKFSRLDIAIDDFEGYMDINQMYGCAKRGCMTAHRVSKARNFEEFFIADGKTHSRTLYVGKSNWMFRFYNKLAERQNHKIDLTDYLKCWNRYEIQLRNDIATAAARILAFESYELGAFAKGFMAAKIDFKIHNKKDSNKSRWKSQKWWLKFLGDVEKLSLTQVAPDPSIRKIGDWLGSQVDTSLATFVAAFDNDPLVLDYFILEGQKKMKKKNDDMIKEFNRNDGLKMDMLNQMRMVVNSGIRDGQHKNVIGAEVLAFLETFDYDPIVFEYFKLKQDAVQLDKMEKMKAYYLENPKEKIRKFINMENYVNENKILTDYDKSVSTHI